MKTHPIVLLCSIGISLGSVWGCSHAGVESEPERSSEPGVRITTDRSSYCRGEPIIVTIRNGLSHEIVATTGNAFCTIVGLFREEADDRWVIVGRCMAGMPPGPVPIPPGTEMTVRLSAEYAIDRPVGPGRYRVELTYRADSEAGDAAIARSKPFEVGECDQADESAVGGG